MLKALELSEVSDKSSLKGPGQVRSKKLFPDTTIAKYLKQSLAFM